MAVSLTSMFCSPGPAKHLEQRESRHSSLSPHTEGFEVAERIHVMAPHPLARLTFKDCRIAAAQRLGEPGQGFKVAMATLDVFRTSVAAAALGFARRALEEALGRAASRKMFSQKLADFQLTQAKLAEMATAIDAAALLTWSRRVVARSGRAGDG